MNGLPSARYYFQWGYASGALINTTTAVIVTSTGDYTTDISGISGGGLVYYRFVTDADGTAYGSISTFPAAAGSGNFLLQTLLRIVVAATICIGVMLIGRNGGGVALLVSAIIGVITFAVVDAMIISLL
jgi:hypothetical protein